MATLAELRAQRDALLTARASGVSSAEYMGRKVNYRSVSETDRLLADLDRQIAAAEGRKPMRVIYTPGQKGL